MSKLVVMVTAALVATAGIASAAGQAARSEQNPTTIALVGLVLIGVGSIRRKPVR